VGTLRLWSFLLLVVLYVVCVVGRQRKYLEAGAPLHLVILYGVCMLGRRRRYVEARVLFSSGGGVWRVRSRASA
jgi:hypothetical protein